MEKNKKETLLQIIVDDNGYGGLQRYTLYYLDKNGEPVTVLLPIGSWNKSVIIDKLIRSQYSQDMMEAIMNNHFLNIAEWIDKKISGDNEAFIDVDYDEMQRWRTVSKEIAEEALKQYPEI